jgi:hypothetical protein
LLARPQVLNKSKRRNDYKRNEFFNERTERHAPSINIVESLACERGGVGNTTGFYFFGSRHASACEEHSGSGTGEKSTLSTWSELVEMTGIPAFEAHLGCRGVQVGGKRSGFDFAETVLVFQSRPD